MSHARKLILHIGFPKTGSSAIQAWLAKNAGELAHHRIAYRNFKEDAAQDRISNGNGRMLLGVFRATKPAFAMAAREFEHGFIPAHFEDFDTAIVSGEGLAGAPKPRLEWFRRYCSERQISVSVLGYCRTIYDHCYSESQQFVKQSAETGTFAEFAATYDNPQCKYLWSWHSIFGNVLTIRIYDAVKKDLIADFVRQVKIDHLGLKTEQGNVNRSLSFSELELLRRVNAYHKGALSRRLSDALIYAFPSRGSDYQFHPQIAEDFERRFGADVRKINEVLFPDAPEQLAVSRPPDSQPGNASPPEPMISLDPAVEVVLKALGEGAAEVKQQETRLRGRLAIALAKIAMPSEKWDIAAKHLQRALQIDPNNVEANRLLSEAYARLENHEGAAGLQRKGKKPRSRRVSSEAGVAEVAEDRDGIWPSRIESDGASITTTGMEVHTMAEKDKGDAAASREARREARRHARTEQRGAGTVASGVEDDPQVAARKEMRDRLAYIRIRMQEIAEERERLMAERTRLVGEKKEGRQAE